MGNLTDTFPVTCKLDAYQQGFSLVHLLPVGFFVTFNWANQIPLIHSPLKHNLLLLLIRERKVGFALLGLRWRRSESSVHEHETCFVFARTHHQKLETVTDFSKVLNDGKGNVTIAIEGLKASLLHKLQQLFDEGATLLSDKAAGKLSDQIKQI